MKKDKRSVVTDALETLGNIIDDTCKRDAIHLAVEPCIAGEVLSPGDHIGVLTNNLALKNTPARYNLCRNCRSFFKMKCSTRAEVLVNTIS